MKVLALINKVPYPPLDGGSQATFNIIKGLYDGGVDLTVLALNPQKHYSDPARIRKQMPNMRLFDFPVDLSVKPMGALLNLFTSRSYNIDRFHIPAYNDKLTDLLKNETFDVVHIESLFMVPYLQTIRRYSKAKVVMRPQNVESRLWKKRAADETSGLKKKYLQLLAGRLEAYELKHLNAYDHLLAITPDDEQEFKQMGCTISSSVLYSGFDFDKLDKYKGVKAANDFFHLGAMDWLPNVEGMNWLLPQVWKPFAEKHPHTEFHIAGRKMPDSYKQMQLPGLFVDGEVEDGYAYIASHGIMLVPLFSGSGIRIKIVEGMAMGKTIIASSIAAAGIKVTHGKELLIADTAEQFQEQMRACLDNPQMCAQIGERAAAFASKNFDNKQLGQQLVSLFQRLV